MGRFGSLGKYRPNGEAIVVNIRARDAPFRKASVSGTVYENATQAAACQRCRVQKRAHMNFAMPVLRSKATLMIVTMKSGSETYSLQTAAAVLASADVYEGQRQHRKWCKVDVRIRAAMGHSRGCHIWADQRGVASHRINRPERLPRIHRKCSVASGFNCGRSAIAAAGNHQYEGATGTGTAKVRVSRRDRRRARNFMHKVAR